MSTKQKIRAELAKRRPFGATAKAVATAIGADLNLVRVTLNHMEDAYIYKWQITEAGHGYTAVWKCVPVPENAPRPETLPPRPRGVYDARYRERKKAKAQAATPVADTPVVEEPTGVRTTIRGPWPTYA